jgi:hypothetical protein
MLTQGKCTRIISGGKSMTPQTKQLVADKLINEMHLTKEQYENACALIDELDLELVEEDE